MTERQLSSIERSRELILEAIGDAADVALVVARRSRSDELAAAGAHQLLSDRRFRELTLEDVCSARGETALLLGAGFSRTDHDVMPRALAVAGMRFHRVLVLPTSFDPTDETVRDALARTEAIVFASQPDSYSQIAELCDARLGHECSFFLDYARYAGSGAGVLNAFGADQDTTPDLTAWLEQIGSHETVRTDRTEVMIAAALMEKRVEYATSSDPGIESIARHALAGHSLTKIEEQAISPPSEPAVLERDAELTLSRLRSAALANLPTGPVSPDARVTAIVLTRDRPQLLLRSLSSIDDSRLPVRTIVIDNNSSPEAARAVQAVSEDRANTVIKRLERNLGTSGARNAAVQMAETDLLLFLDDDAELLPGALEHLVTELDEHPDAVAVSATVVRPDGTIIHSAGGVEVSDEMVTFELLGDGLPYASASLPPSGAAGWAPLTAVLIRRDVLIEQPMDADLGYFSDNDWSHRVSLGRSAPFRRSREALVLHHLEPKHAATPDFVSRSRMAELLVAYASFYRRHGLLLGPWLFDHVPELRALDGSRDLAAARLLMELVTAKGTDWTFMAWMNGDLDGLLSGNRQIRALEEALAHHKQLVERERWELAGLRARASHDARTIARLDANVRRVDQSVLWQLIQRVRTRVFKLLGGEDSAAVNALQGGVRGAGRLFGTKVVASGGTELKRARLRPEDIVFASHEPEVSIVMPLYAHADLTEAALWSILDYTDGVSYEVILVDDSEDAATKQLLRRVRGAQMIVNDSNLGYMRSVERGVEIARGRWLVLCNNDIEVQPGWLAALMECGESQPDVAIVAPKFLYPDGSLAEAGGIIWRDGTGANFGRGDDPAGCHYEYRREIDYGSAAALMVKTEFWRAVGGFDQRFLPMYYEDTDLCFEARSRGLRVMYEPRAQVIHLEGASAGVDERAGHKRHQAENRPKFVEKWRRTLDAEHLDKSPENLWLGANLRRVPRVLVVDHRVPMWDRDSGSLRMRGMLETLIELGCHVSLLPDNETPTQPYTSELQRIGVEVLYGIDPETELARVGRGLSLVILSRPLVAGHWLGPVREYVPEAPVVFDTVDLHWVREARREALDDAGARNGGSLSADAIAMRELERAMIRGTDATVVVTHNERAQVLADVPDATVHVVPNVNQVRPDVPPAPGRRGVVFVGGFEHTPNVDGAQMLIREVMPLVWREMPDVPVKIVGADPPEAIRSLGSPLVEIAGWVPDLDPVLDSARVMLAPLTYGAGLKGKVTQALACGLPVVTTPIGAEGLDATDGGHLLIGGTAEELAAGTLRVLRDDELWSRLSRSGQRLAADRYSSEVMSGVLRALLDQTFARAGAPHPVGMR